MILMNDEQDVFYTIVTPISKRNERQEDLDKTPPQSQCFMSLKIEFLTLKNFVTGEVNTILEKLNISTHLNN